MGVCGHPPQPNQPNKMNQPIQYAPVPKDSSKRRKQIEDILATGQHVRFTMGDGDIIKDVDSFMFSDDTDDLVAYDYTGQSPYVLWESDKYDISAIPNPNQ